MTLCTRIAWLGMLSFLGGTLPVLSASPDQAIHAPPAQPSPTGGGSPTEALKGINTFVLITSVDSWVEGPRSPYNVTVTIKMKLERAGFTVVLDQAEPHDATLAITHRETPGRQYRMLERGTIIYCEVRASHPDVGEFFRHRFQASTDWPTPVGSLYWNAVRNLEEDPYYYYLGEILRGRIATGMDIPSIFTRMLAKPPLDIPDDQPLTGRVVANQGARLNAIEELGRLQAREALPALWRLAEESTRLERKAAIQAIARIGEPDSLERLIELSTSARDPAIRTAAREAVEQAEALHGHPLP